MSVTPLLFKINDLPAHALLVHLTVVLVPVVALGAVAYLVPKWRDWLRWPLLVGAAIAFLSIWASYLSGDNFKESVSFFQDNPQIEKHEDYANVFRIVGSVFTLALIGVTAGLHRRTDALRTVAAGVTAALAVVTLVYVFLTGEAGAKAVYPPDSFSDASGSSVSSR
ncbi:DUF2231 domain-containing protein [Nocardioides sp.]|uniref:DUF2231 domain-containing protein n=1 Tax=Nocardioides sp. TaxID=35761 RepID=UPI002721C71F|nr:DUF2231 domain-containing protein [Nocardioides sp.]MDO9458326.1 hypothetical protein [Nocardioides sp.]